MEDAAQCRVWSDAPHSGGEFASGNLLSHSVEGYDAVSDWLFLGGLAWNITRPLHERGIVVWYC